jgi:hypothetical protein
LLPDHSTTEQEATADMADFGYEHERLPAAVRRNFIACFVIGIVLLMWMLYISIDGVIFAVLSSYWFWFASGELVVGANGDPVEARLYYAPWMMLVLALLVIGNILLLLAAILSIVISSKGISGRSAGVEFEVLPPASLATAANQRVHVIVGNRLL